MDRLCFVLCASECMFVLGACCISGCIFSVLVISWLFSTCVSDVVLLACVLDMSDKVLLACASDVSGKVLSACDTGSLLLLLPPGASGGRAMFWWSGAMVSDAGVLLVLLAVLSLLLERIRYCCSPAGF
jgi:hypothetical protein